MENATEKTNKTKNPFKNFDISKTVKSIVGSRSLKYGSNSLVLIAAVVAIAVVVNILVGLAPIKWDLTSNKLYSLGDESKKILKAVKKDIVIYGLFDETKLNAGDEYKQMTQLLDQYRKYSHIKVQYVDTDKNPGFIKSIDPENLKSLAKQDFVVKCGNKMKKLSYYDLFDVQFDQQSFQQYTTGSKAEQGFTGAIKYVTSDVTPVVYFAEGHDEEQITSGFSTLNKYLDMNNYEVKTINLITSEKIPDDAAIVLFASPKKDLTSAEGLKVKNYLRSGGKAVFMFDALDNTPQLTEFEKLLAENNLSLNYDRVVEKDDNRHVPENPYDILPDVQTNSIIDQSYAMIMPKSRSINILKNVKEYITVTSLMKTSDKAVGEQIDKSRGADIPGPLDLAAAVENKGGSKIYKILVFGNGTFMSDNAIKAYGNYSSNGMYFFLTALNWLQDKKEEVTIAPKTYQNIQLKITAQQAFWTNIFVVILLPILILGSGMLVWLRRRHL